MFKVNKKQFIWNFAAYLLGITAILRANFNYIDDMSRVMNGVKGWSFYSRFVTDFLSTFVHGDNYLADISPLPQILAAAIMALAGCYLLKILAKEELNPVLGMIAVIPLALSPYFLQCFSYKYDAPYMALSVLVSVIPPLFYKPETKHRVRYLIAVVVAILIVCTTYQAGSGILPMLVIAIALQKWNNKEKIKEILVFVGISAAGYLLALIIFRLFIVVPVDFYASTNLFSLKDMFPGIITNLATYFTVIIKDFRQIWLILIGIIMVLFICQNIMITKRSRLAAMFISIICLLLMAILSFGAYLALEKPLYDPRGMYGFGVFLAIISIVVVSIDRPYIKYSRIVCAALSWLLVVFAFNYGNALSEQKKYTEYRIEQVISTINNLELDDTAKIVEISGSIGYAPTIENRPDNYRMMKNLIPIAFSEDRSWGYTMLLDYYDMKNLKQDSSIDLKTQDLDVLADTQLHTIKGDNNHLLIILK